MTALKRWGKNTKDVYITFIELILKINKRLFENFNKFEPLLQIRNYFYFSLYHYK